MANIYAFLIELTDTTVSDDRRYQNTEILMLTISIFKFICSIAVRHQNKHMSSSTSNNMHSKAAGTRPERVQCESLFLVFAGQGLDINAYSYHIKNHFSETLYLFTFPLFGPA